MFHLTFLIPTTWDEVGFSSFSPAPSTLSPLLLNPSRLVNKHNRNKKTKRTSTHHHHPPLQGNFEYRPTPFRMEARHFGRSLGNFEGRVLTVETLVNGPAEKPVLINDIHTSCSCCGGDVIPGNRWQPSFSEPSSWRSQCSQS